LQEAVDADLLLHVVDASNPGYVEQIHEVQRVLAEIGAAAIPQVLVFNKLDALPADQQPVQRVDSFELDGVQCPRIFLSARTLEGLPALRLLLSDIVTNPGGSRSGMMSNPESRGAEL
jgi:GTP-binding protein HflX